MNVGKSYINKNEYLNQKNKYVKGILNSGMKYITTKNKFHNSCSIMLLVRVGSKHENKDEYGCAHFLEHMLFKGSKKYKKNIEINKLIDELKISCNASTNKHFTEYHFSLPDYNFEKGMALMNEMVFNSILDNNEFKKEKQVVIEEINKVVDESLDYAGDLLEKELFEGSSLSHFILGDKKSILNLKRKTMLDFYNKYYFPENCCISLSGNIPSNYKKILEKTFFKSNKCIGHNIKPLINMSNLSVNIVKRKQEQIALCIGFPIFNLYNKKKYMLDILIDILYGGMTSRLWIALREKNPIIYGMNIFYMLYEEIGYINISLTLQKKNLEKALKIIHHEISELKKKVIPKKEFDTIIKNLLYNIESEEDDNLDLAEYFGEKYLLDEDIVTYKDLGKIYKKVRREQLKELFIELFNFNTCKIIQIGDATKSEIQKIVKVWDDKS